MNTRDPMNDRTMTISDRVAVSRRQSLSQVMSPKSSRPKSSMPKRSMLKTRNLGTDPYQIHERFVRSSLTERYMKEFGKVCADVTWFQSQCIPNTSRWKALQTRTLKMENYEECRLHHCIHRIEKTMNPLECQSQRGNLLHGFHFEVKNRERIGKSIQDFCFQNADPSNLGRSLFEGNKDHLLSQAKSELRRQEHQVGSLNNCISEPQQHSHAQRLELQDAQHGYIESRREQARPQEELSMNEKVLRDTQIRSMHEVGEMRDLKSNKLTKSH